MAILDFPRPGGERNAFMLDTILGRASFKTCGVVRSGDRSEPPKGLLVAKRLGTFSQVGCGRWWPGSGGVGGGRASSKRTFKKYCSFTKKTQTTSPLCPRQLLKRRNHHATHAFFHQARAPPRGSWGPRVTRRGCDLGAKQLVQIPDH